MADVVFSVVIEFIKCLALPTIHQGRYLFRVNKVIKNLEQEKEELISKKDSILSLVDQAIERTEIIEDAVYKWLYDVVNLLEKVEKLEQEMKESHCFQGWCPTWRRHCLCKKMATKIKTITDLKTKSNFETFSHLAPLSGVEYNSSPNFTYFESTKEAYNKLLSALKDDNAYMIGLYGMGGSGKTTLATEVGKKARELNLFGRVIPITVSQTPNIESIQDQMADMLDFKMEEKTKEGKARQLWLKLEEEKRVLIILDDVWAKLDLKKIGIRLEDNKQPNFKVLLTTHERQVCDFMDCQRQIFLNLLSDSEAWSLFQKSARIGDGSSSNVLEVAQEISNKCRGLPIAIEAVGSSLKGKGDDDYTTALESLRRSEPFDDPEDEGVGRAYNCLKLSYDYLRNKVAEVLLLMCSMLPEDQEIPIEDLIIYGVGLGICKNLNSFHIARSQIRASINKLVDSCLLLLSEKRKNDVKMHDMVRAVVV